VRQLPLPHTYTNNIYIDDNVGIYVLIMCHKGDKVGEK